MDEKVLNDEILDKNNACDDLIDDQNNSGDDLLLKVAVGAGAAVIGVCAGLAWRKFGPGITKRWTDHQIKTISKKQKKLAKMELENQTKLNELMSKKAEME